MCLTWVPMISAWVSTKKSTLRQGSPSSDPEPAVKPRLVNISGWSTTAWQEVCRKRRKTGKYTCVTRRSSLVQEERLNLGLEDHNPTSYAAYTSPSVLNHDLREYGRHRRIVQVSGWSTAAWQEVSSRGRRENQTTGVRPLSPSLKRLTSVCLSFNPLP